MDAVLKKVLKLVMPKKAEVSKINKVSKEIISKLKHTAKELGVKIELVLAGSASRGTYLTGNHDLDFFMRFNSESDIKKYYKEIVKPNFKELKLIHGTRDYYKFKHNGFDIEIVPSVKFSHPSKAKNSTDISYFHINYLKKKLTPSMKHEVLILKQFLKANNVYGAESARNGFSGYVTELLIVKFKTFKKLINYFEKATPKIIIDIEKHYKDEEEVLKKIDKNKTTGPLIIVDPLLPKRNAAASLSYNTFSEFLFKARYFLREPIIKLFNTRGLKMSLVKSRSKRRGTKLITLKYKIKHSDPDITKAKLLRKLKQLKSKLDNEGWDIFNYGITDDNKFFFEFESLKVAKAKRHYGPFVWVETKNFDQFFKKHKNNKLGKPYVYNNKLVVDVIRAQEVKEEIKDYLKDFIC